MLARAPSLGMIFDPPPPQLTEMTYVLAPPALSPTISPRTPPPNPNSRQSSTKPSDMKTTRSRLGQSSNLFPTSTPSSMKASGCLDPFLWVSPVTLLRVGYTFRESSFPEGTVLSVPIYTIHRDPEIWGADAEAFRPERWFELDQARIQEIFYPFSHGPRSVELHNRSSA
jgi:hypothetical protein